MARRRRPVPAGEPERPSGEPDWPVPRGGSLARAYDRARRQWLAENGHLPADLWPPWVTRGLAGADDVPDGEPRGRDAGA